MPTYRVNVPFKVEAEDAAGALQLVYNLVSTAVLAGLNADDGVISGSGMRLADLVHEVPEPPEPITDPVERAAAMERLAVAWSLAHPERLDKSRQFVRVAIRDGGLRCRYCKLDLFFYDSLNALDHVIPKNRPRNRDRAAAWDAAVANLGVSVYDDINVVVACRDCNGDRIGGLKRDYVPAGDSPGARVADADREIRERRAARINGSLRDLLERLIEGGQHPARD